VLYVSTACTVSCRSGGLLSFFAESGEAIPLSFGLLNSFQQHGLLATSCAGAMNGPLVLCDLNVGQICMMKERTLAFGPAPEPGVPSSHGSSH